MELKEIIIIFVLVSLSVGAILQATADYYFFQNTLNETFEKDGYIKSGEFYYKVEKYNTTQYELYRSKKIWP